MLIFQWDFILKSTLKTYIFSVTQTANSLFSPPSPFPPSPPTSYERVNHKVPSETRSQTEQTNAIMCNRSRNLLGGETQFLSAARTQIPYTWQVISVPTCSFAPEVLYYPPQNV